MEIKLAQLDEPHSNNALSHTAEASMLKFPVSMGDWPKEIICPEMSSSQFIKMSPMRNLMNEPYAVEYINPITKQTIIVFND